MWLRLAVIEHGIIHFCYFCSVYGSCRIEDPVHKYSFGHRRCVCDSKHKGLKCDQCIYFYMKNTINY